MVHAARNGFFYALDRTNGSFVAGKQYVDRLTWTTGLDPKTGRPLNYDPNSDIQIYTPGSHGMRGQAAGRTCPTNSGGKNWEPTAYNPELGLLYIPSIEGWTSANLRSSTMPTTSFLIELRSSLATSRMLIPACLPSPGNKHEATRAALQVLGTRA